MIKISYIIPMYNAEKFISKCISSIKEQDVPNDEYEIIVINDGSTDNSLKKAEECLADIKYSQLLTQENQGQASARNKGFAIAKGKYIMFVDADDWLNLKSIDKLIRQAETNNTDIAISSMKSYRADGTFTIGNDYPKQQIVVDGNTAIMDGIIFGSVCARLFRRDFLRKNKLLFQEGIKHEDVLFSVKSLLSSERVLSCNVCTYSYRWNEGSTDRSFDCENFRKSLHSDLTIANELIGLSKLNELKEPLTIYLQKRGNSMIISNIIQIIKKGKSSHELLREYITRCKQLGLYPISHQTLSWKTHVLLPIINSQMFINLIGKLVSR